VEGARDGVTPTEGIGLPPGRLADLFPFHFALDRDLRIVQAGPSLVRVCPAAGPGGRFDEVFRVARPPLGGGFEALSEAARELMVLASRDGPLVLRGEMTVLEEGATLLFVGQPWLTDLSDLAALGLVLDDFPSQSPVVELLHLLQAQRVSVGEMRQLNERLQAQGNELRRAQDRLEEELAESERAEALTRSILDTAADGILTIDAKGVIQTVNAAFERLFGYAAEEVVGRNVSLLMPEPDRSAHDGYMQRYLETGEARVIGRGREVEGVRRDGTRFPLYLSVGEMRVGNERRFTGIVQDVTERHEVDRLKKQFVAMVSHELRTPLTSLRGSLGLLSVGAVGALPEGAGAILAIAERSTVRLVDLVNDILDLERLEAAQLSLERQPTPLVTVLQHARETVEALAVQHQVALEVPDADAVVLGDRDRLIQVVVNLLFNAIKFSPEGGRVEVGTRLEGSRVRVEVSDEGRGVPPEMRQRIFEPFRQVEGSDARQKGGTGLGLAICRSIVEQHGGAIGVEDREGPGATFWLLHDGRQRSVHHHFVRHRQEHRQRDLHRR
jgi:PAS domain S-box-containing protein